MAITIYENKAMAHDTKMVQPGRRLWKTRDGLLVLDGDPRAYQLYAHPHHRVPEDELKELLAKSGLDKPKPKPKRAKKKAASKKRSSKSST